MRAPATRTLLATGFLLLLGACGGSPRASKAPFVTSESTTAVPGTTLPVATVTVTPPSAPVGGTVKLAVSAFQPSESFKFEIEFPNGHKFTGQPHVVAADGTASADYKITTGNPAGKYVVRAAGDKGSMAQSDFTVTGTTGATPGATTTTAKTATTTRTTTRSTVTTRPAVTTTSSY